MHVIYSWCSQLQFSIHQFIISVVIPSSLLHSFLFQTEFHYQSSSIPLLSLLYLSLSVLGPHFHFSTLLYLCFSVIGPHFHFSALLCLSLSVLGFHFHFSTLLYLSLSVRGSHFHFSHCCISVCLYLVPISIPVHCSIMHFIVTTCLSPTMTVSSKQSYLVRSHW